ncbi:hypothetical protein BaOVIS_002370 [Babesia ovis]|uniref:DOT1 domain-containing protein n=1 Tax=Babesia ovis TaxID=5869 RepID=A0A9W5T9V0_BABOV|nr:hypothetical protein BaOVIS_002370 [Babesia ovis]
MFDMDPSLYTNSFCAKRVILHQHDVPSMEINLDGTPQRVANVAKRRQVLTRHRSAEYRAVESSTEANEMTPAPINKFLSSSLDALPQLMRHGKRVCDKNNYPLVPYHDIITEYRQLAQSQFRRIYYDLSRGIGVRDDGINYLFKSGTNDISTSTYGMYGEIRPSCLQKICAEMQRFGLDNRSVILDLGSGRGAPNLLFAHQAPVFASIGIELCPVSYTSSVHNIIQYLKVDIARMISEITGFSSDEDDKSNFLTEDNAAVEEPETPLRTPKRKLASMSKFDASKYGTSVEHNSCNSVATQYQNYSMYVDETSETPRGSQSKSSSDDGSLFYDTLKKFSEVPSSLGAGFCNEDISAFDNFDGASHIYSFDIAMEKALVNNIVRQFVNTKTAWLFASFNSDLIERFELRECFLAARIPCQMYKSGERRCCYVYVKRDWEKIKCVHDAHISRLYGLSTEDSNQRQNTAGLSRTTRSGRRSATASVPTSQKTTRASIGDADISTKTMLLSQFNEPVNVLELVKLAKMPLEVQLGWYLAKVSRPDVVLTRSKTINTIDQMRRGLCEHRSKLLEIIATSSEPKNTLKYVTSLQRHIQQKYMPVRSFPLPVKWGGIT